MRPVQRNEIVSIGDYETLRPHFRNRVIAEKRERRVALNDFLTGVFENRDSVLLQIQEMLRTERITNEPAILHEIETYNELVPGPHELSLTLFVEVADKEAREQKLVELTGLEDAIFLDVSGTRIPFTGKRQGASSERTTAVHYLKARLPANMTLAKSKVMLCIEHPNCHVARELPDSLCMKLNGELLQEEAN